MDLITKSVMIRGTSDLTGAILRALCNYGTDEDPLAPGDDEKWAAVRNIRNELLLETEWTQRPDAVLSLDEKTAWQDYCQALRDIPQTYATPEEVVWPTKPGGT